MTSEVPPGAKDYLSHLPIGTQRDAMKQWIDTSAPGDAQAYEQAFEKLVGVVRALWRRARGVPVLYLSDSGFAPYGGVARPELAARVETAIRYLVEHGATSVVIACNAASTVLDSVESRGLGVPVSGVIVPALSLVPRRFRGTIGVVGGERTIRSQLYRRGLEGPGRVVVQRIAQPLTQ